MTLAGGERLNIRRFVLQDLDAFMAYRGDAEVARFQSWESMSRDAAEGFIAHVGAVTPLMRPGHWVQVAITDPDADTLLGDLGLFLSKDGAEAEIGVTLSREAQGRGIASEAVQLGCSIIWDATGAQIIWGISDLRNAPSLKLIERCGFVFSHEESTDGIEERFYCLSRPSGETASTKGR